jgi:hypothetical protein
VPRFNSGSGKWAAEQRWRAYRRREELADAHTMMGEIAGLFDDPFAAYVFAWWALEDGPAVAFEESAAGRACRKTVRAWVAE